MEGARRPPPIGCRSSEPYDFASDPVFGQFKPWGGSGKAGFDVNFVGQLTDVSFNAGWADAHRTQDREFTSAPYPPAHFETFEWEMLLSSILGAHNHFTMIEAGAGYGRWLISAVCAIRLRRPDLSFSLMGVEAEPTHFQWMHKHFRDNGVDPAKHRLIQGVVDAKDGESIFMSGHDPAEFYGAYILAYNRQTDALGDNRPHKVNAYSIAALLRQFDRVNLMDFDIQGAEAQAILPGLEALTCHGPMKLQNEGILADRTKRNQLEINYEYLVFCGIVMKLDH